MTEGERKAREEFYRINGKTFGEEHKASNSMLGLVLALSLGFGAGAILTAFAQLLY